MKSKKVRIVSIVLMMVMLLVSLPIACYAEEVSIKKKMITVIDDEEQYVEIACPPKRIVVLHREVADILYALGCKDSIVGRSMRMTTVPSLKAKKVVGGEAAPAVELIMKLNADLVIPSGCGSLRYELRDKLASAKIPVLMMNHIVGIDELKAKISLLGLIMDKREVAGKLLEFIDNYYELVRSRVKDLRPDQKPRVLFLCGHSKSPWGVHGSESTRANKLLIPAGGISVSANLPYFMPTASQEWCMQQNPDIIYYDPFARNIKGGLESIRDEIMNRPGLKETRAVREGKVYVCTWSSESGLWQIVGFVYMAKSLHPELFEDIDPCEVKQEVARLIYGEEQMINDPISFYKWW